MKRHVCLVLFALVGLTLWSLPLFAQSPPASEPKIDTGDTAWMLTSAALVLFMTIPGLFLFYGGLVRSKNVLGMLMQNFMMVGIITFNGSLSATASPLRTAQAFSAACNGWV